MPIHQSRRKTTDDSEPNAAALAQKLIAAVDRYESDARGSAGAKIGGLIDVVGDDSGTAQRLEEHVRGLFGIVRDFYSEMGLGLAGRYRLLVSNFGPHKFANASFIPSSNFHMYKDSHPFFSSPLAKAYDGCISISTAAIDIDAERWADKLGAGGGFGFGQDGRESRKEAIKNVLLLGTLLHETAHAIQLERGLAGPGGRLVAEGGATALGYIILREAGFRFENIRDGHGEMELGSLFGASPASVINEMINRYDSRRVDEVAGLVMTAIDAARNGVDFKGSYTAGSVLFTAIYLSEGKSMRAFAKRVLGIGSVEDLIREATMAHDALALRGMRRA